jgi:hypothetical protein
MPFAKIDVMVTFFFSKTVDWSDESLTSLRLWKIDIIGRTADAQKARLAAGHTDTYRQPWLQQRFRYLRNGDLFGVA